MLKTTAILGASGAALLVLAGCGHTTREVVTTPPTVVVADASRAEVRTPPPSSGQVWRDGYWAYKGDRYVWVPGHWESATPN